MKERTGSIAGIVKWKLAYDVNFSMHVFEKGKTIFDEMEPVKMIRKNLHKLLAVFSFYYLNPVDEITT